MRTSVPGSLDLLDLRFDAPSWLPLLAVPATCALLCAWRLWQRVRDARRIRRGHRVPVRERISRVGDLVFWTCLSGALACTILALARPVAVTSLVRTAGIDLVILQDGSASMRVPDVRGDRWQRSMVFLRTLGEALRWKDDRIALALFANIATPQIRLTRDPNTFFFFLDHLDREPPFRLSDDGTWDTNIERGIHWGLRVIAKDEEIRGPSPNARAFVLLSDGQAWSGEVEAAITQARARGIPIDVVGVGTTVGGSIPDPQRQPGQPILVSALDRDSLSVIATAGGGRYFELDREPDLDIANAIIATTRARAGSAGVVEGTDDLYWQALACAGVLVALGGFALRDRTAIALQVAAAAAVLAWVATLG